MKLSKIIICITLLLACQNARAMHHPRTRFLLTVSERERVVQAFEQDNPAFLKILLGRGRLSQEHSWTSYSASLGEPTFGKEYPTLFLHCAVRFGRMAIVQFLLDSGFDVNHPLRPYNLRRNLRRSSEYFLPLSHATEAPEPVRSELIDLLVLHGAHLWGPDQEFSKAFRWWYQKGKRKYFMAFMHAPRVAPSMPSDWPLVKERLVALFCRLNRVPHTIPRGVKTMLCRYAVRAEWPLVKQYPLPELCYLAQKGVVDQGYVVQKLVNAHSEVLHKALNIPLAGGKTPFETLSYSDLDPNPESISKHYGQVIRAMYKSMVCAKASQ